jgi:hypothetical protein
MALLRPWHYLPWHYLPLHYTLRHYLTCHDLPRHCSPRHHVHQAASAFEFSSTAGLRLTGAGSHGGIHEQQMLFHGGYSCSGAGCIWGVGYDQMEPHTESVDPTDPVASASDPADAVRDPAEPMVDPADPADPLDPACGSHATVSNGRRVALRRAEWDVACAAFEFRSVCSHRRQCCHRKWRRYCVVPLHE